jgi:FKBP-type peptidyl-prolyl cis-trans isomerase FklB
MKLNSIAILTASSVFLLACGSDKSSQDETIVEETTEVATAAAPESDPALGELNQKLSYILGTNLTGQFKRDGIELDINAFTMAVNDVNTSAPSRLSPEDVQKTIATMQQLAQEKQQQAQQEQELVRQEQSASNKTIGQAYLAANAEKEGIIVTESGLQYKEVVSGDGAMPTADKTVVVHYKGSLIDGTVFDSSYERGQPAEFPVTGVIQGWVEALQLMNVGDKFELTIPADLAYGQRGSSPTIGPDATLLFDVELIEIK